MIKYINNDYPGFENKTIKLDSNFEKVAYEFGDPIKEFIEKHVKPTKGSNYYLINAMGAGETYGSNSRGDYFPREELKKHHKTFETSPAYAYVQHRNKDPRISLGQVLHSHFNEDTDRVELVQRLDWDKIYKFAPDWLKALLQTDQSYNTSMGCRVEYDQCSHCGKKHKLMNEYCDHLRRNMNQFVDGIKVVAINIGPKFFDNSAVRLGADRTARSIKKIASDPEVDEMLNAEHTIMNDAELKNRSYFFIDSTIPKEVAFIREETIDKIASESYHMNKEELDGLLEYDLNDILGATKLAGAELLPWEYQYVTLKKLGSDELADKYWNTNVRFKLEDSPSGKDISLSYTPEAFAKFAEFIPLKSNYKHFAIYRGLSKTASNSPKKWTIGGGPIFDLLGQSYADYVSKDMRKTAGLEALIPILSSLFITLPSLLRLQKSDMRDEQISNDHIKMIQNTKSRATEIPMVPGLLNPVYKNPLFKTASIKESVNKGFNNLRNRLPKMYDFGVPLGVGIGSSLYLTGKDREREAMGDPRTGTGLAGIARKHPILTAAGGAILTHLGMEKIRKTATDMTEYKNFLKTASQEQLYEFINTLPDNLFFDLIN